MEDLKNKVINSGIWSTVQTFGKQFFQFAVFLFLSRLLGPSIIGIVALADIVIELLILFMRFGIPEAIIQQNDVSEKKSETAFWTVFLMGALTSAFAFFCSGYIAAIFEIPELESIISVIAVIPFISSLSVIHEARVMRKFGFKPLAVIALVANAIAGILALTLAFLGFGLWSLVAMRITEMSLLTLGTWLVFPWRPRFHFDFTEFRSLWNFGRHIMLSAVLVPLNYRLVELILGLLFNATTVGYYRLARRCFDFLADATSAPLVAIALPTFSRLKNNKQGFETAFLRMTQFCSILTFPVCLGTIIIAPDLITLAFGQQWLESGHLLQILCLALIPASLLDFFWPTLSSLGRADWVARTNIALLIFSATCTVIAAPYGVKAVALAFSISTILAFPIAFYLLKRTSGIKIRRISAAIASPGIAAVVMFGVLFAVRMHFDTTAGPMILTLILISLGPIIYVPATMICSPSSTSTVMEIVRHLGITRK